MRQDGAVTDSEEMTIKHCIVMNQ